MVALTSTVLTCDCALTLRKFTGRSEKISRSTECDDDDVDDDNDDIPLKYRRTTLQVYVVIHGSLC